MKLLFTGDIHFRGLEPLDMPKCEKIIKEVKPYLEKADFNVVNLETPLANEEKYTPIYKSGPNLISLPEDVIFLKALGVHVATLANNHTGDFGQGAVKNTLEVLDKNSILYCGAGKDVNQAYNACRLRKDGVSASLISVCENEFGTATEDAYGSAGYNARLLLNKIKQEKKESDYVVVIFHGGNEYYPLPSPDTQDRYRLICDMGADAVVAGHTHCPQGYEVYDGKPIIYSMGNFLFNSDPDWDVLDSWYYGYMVELDADKSGIGFRLIPCKLDREEGKIHVFEGADRDKMLEYIDSLSEIIKDRVLLDNYFNGWAYLHRWVPKEPDSYEDLRDYNSAENYNALSCEAHNSLAKRVLRLCFLDSMEESKEWAERIETLSKMPL
ncbi:MAG: CapA family protein [Clostridia bacterium]|nr:CapA family protein [Clostridia bacterium]